MQTIKKFKYEFVTFLLTLFFLGTSFGLKHKKLPKIKVSSEESEINFKEEFYQIFNLGQKKIH